jgi:hypothetical protein
MNYTLFNLNFNTCVLRNYSKSVNSENRGKRLGKLGEFFVCGNNTLLSNPPFIQKSSKPSTK